MTTSLFFYMLDYSIEVIEAHVAFEYPSISRDTRGLKS